MAIVTISLRIRILTKDQESNRGYSQEDPERINEEFQTVQQKMKKENTEVVCG